MSMFVSEDSIFEAEALQRAVDQDRRESAQRERRLPHGAGIGFVIKVWLWACAIALVVGVVLAVRS